MAPRIKAVNAYRPRIEQGNTVQKPELIRAVYTPPESSKAHWTRASRSCATRSSSSTGPARRQGGWIGYLLS